MIPRTFICAIPLLFAYGVSQALVASGAPQPPPAPRPSAPAPGANPARVDGDAAVRTRTFMGVIASPVSEETRRLLGFPESHYLQVEFIAPGSPADKAGLKPKDILISFDGQQLINPEQLRAIIRAHQAGEKVIMAYMRGGKLEHVDIELSSAVEAPRRRVISVPPKSLGAKGAAEDENVEARLLKILEESQPVMEVHRSMLQKYEAGKPVRVEAQTLITVQAVTEDGTLAIRVGGSGKVGHIMDSTGKVLFDGPLNTPEDWGAVPDSCREVLKRLDDSIDVRQTVIMKDLEPGVAPKGDQSTSGPSSSPSRDKASAGDSSSPSGK